MATLCGGGGCSGITPDRLSCRVPNRNPITPRMCFLKNPDFRNPGLKVSASMRASEKNEGKMKKIGSDLIGCKSGKNKEAIASERLDGWMRESVGEIVKNLREAPLFVHVHSRCNGGGGAVELRTEKAVDEENWEAMKAKWERGDAVVPEGLIFVEELNETADEFGDHDHDCDRGNGGGSVHEGMDGDVTQAWGVVVQGRGGNCGPVCYLLKTSSAGSGLGMCSTHFCLMKVTSFRGRVKNQFKSFWLLQNH